MKPRYPLGKKVLEFLYHLKRRAKANNVSFGHRVSTEDAPLGATSLCLNAYHCAQLLVPFVVKESTARYWQMLKVNVLIGTPRIIMTLAQRAERMGIEHKKEISLETTQYGGEVLADAQGQHRPWDYR